MKVFISWSGELSRSVAESLRMYLPCILQDLDVFVSQHDLESGSRWAAELAARLNQSTFGILCLTPQNQLAPWMLYEAGVLNRAADGRTCGLLLGGLTPANVSGPLAQFQHRRMNREEFLLLLRDINQRMDSPLPDESLRLIFEKWWPDLSAAHTDAQQAAPTKIAATEHRSDREVLEEILERIRATPSGFAAQPSEGNDTLNAAQALLRVVRSRSAEEVAFLLRINRFKDVGDHDAVESYAELHSPIAGALQNLGLLWRSPQGRLVMNRFLGEQVLPMLLEYPPRAAESKGEGDRADA